MSESSDFCMCKFDVVIEFALHYFPVFMDAHMYRKLVGGFQEWTVEVMRLWCKLLLNFFVCMFVLKFPKYLCTNI